MRYSLPLFSSLFILSLTACSTGNPGPFPRGYSSYDQVYKSVEGKPAKSVGYGYTNEKNKTVTNRIQGVASVLVGQLDEELSFNTDKIYLVKPKDSVFYNTFDHALRTELTSRGYILQAEKSESAKIVHFVAHHAKAPCTNKPIKGTVDNTPLYLALAVDVDKKKVPSNLVGAVYDVPVYGGFTPTVLVKAAQQKNESDVCE